MNSDEQFEAWFASKFPKIKEKASDPTDPVRGQVKEVARYAWKYSRETLQIELPERDPLDPITHWLMYDLCRESIETAGLKVK